MRKFLLYGLFFSSMTSPCWAQDTGAPPADSGAGSIVIADQIRDSAITVVATGLRGWIQASGQPLTIIDAGEIDAVQGADIVRVLAHAPGVTFSRNGGPG